MMRNYTENSRLLNGDAPKRSVAASTVNTLKRMHTAFKRPIKRMEPKLKAINEAMSYADPLVYTTMGLGLYDATINNAAGFPNKYRPIANLADMIVLPYLLLTFAASCLYFTRDTNKPSRKNTGIAIFFFVLNALHNGIAAGNFTEDTAIALMLSQSDPDGSSPSDSDNNTLYHVLLPACSAVALALGAMTLMEDCADHYENQGRVFAKRLRNCFSDNQKNVLSKIYTGVRTLFFGSQFNGGAINQAFVSILVNWLHLNLIDAPAKLRTALFLGGHAAGITLETLLLASQSEPMKEFIDRAFLVLAGVFFVEEYFTDVATSISLDRTNTTSSMEGESNTIIAAKSMAVIATWLTILVGSAVLGVNKYRKNAANQEMKDRTSGIVDEAQDRITKSSSSLSSSSDDILPQTAPTTPRASSSSQGIFAQPVTQAQNDIYVNWLNETSNLSASA